MSILQPARRVFRKFFPRLRHPILDAPLPEAGQDVEFESIYRSVALQSDDDPFVTERYAEGRRWRGVLKHYLPGKGALRVLDLGGGNGAIELALTVEKSWFVVSVDTSWNDTVCALRLRRVVADAANLPFRAGVFDAVTCLETVEHFPDPDCAAAEIAAVTKPGGLLLITTPPRWRFAFRGDPHFGIPCLVLLPPFLQRVIAARKGFAEPHHYVNRIYSSTRQLRSLFGEYDWSEVLSRSRAPKRWFWDAILFRRA